MTTDSVPFVGVIRATTPDGRSGVVVLTVPCQGKEYAVISTETKGRVALMNGSGRLEKDMRVRGHAAIGTQSLMVLDVERDGPGE